MAGDLARREWHARVVAGRTPSLVVANPDDPELNERVRCARAEDGSLCWWWSSGAPIASVDDLDEAVGRLMHVLRPVQRRIVGRRTPGQPKQRAQEVNK